MIKSELRQKKSLDKFLKKFNDDSERDDDVNEHHAFNQDSDMKEPRNENIK